MPILHGVHLTLRNEDRDTPFPHGARRAVRKALQVSILAAHVAGIYAATRASARYSRRSLDIYHMLVALLLSPVLRLAAARSQTSANASGAGLPVDTLEQPLWSVRVAVTAARVTSDKKQEEKQLRQAFCKQHRQTSSSLVLQTLCNLCAEARAPTVGVLLPLPSYSHGGALSMRRMRASRQLTLPLRVCKRHCNAMLPLQKAGAAAPPCGTTLLPHTSTQAAGSPCHSRRLECWPRYAQAPAHQAPVPTARQAGQCSVRRQLLICGCVQRPARPHTVAASDREKEAASAPHPIWIIADSPCTNVTVGRMDNMRKWMAEAAHHCTDRHPFVASRFRYAGRGTAVVHTTLMTISQL
jgi:hypothetical protein